MASKTLTRRAFAQTSAAAAAWPLAGRAGTRRRAHVGERPNVLLILNDQERFPLNLPPLELPNHRRLRERAVEFTQAMCTYPLCSPSRASIFTGRWPHQAGIFTNVDFAAWNPSLDRRLPTLPRVFAQAGYVTAHFGKWHLSRRAHSVGSLRRYGFTEPHVSNQLFAYGSDDRVTDNAARWLERSPKKAPWFMVYAPINPHDICLPFLDRYYRGPRDYPVTLPPNYSASPAPDVSGPVLEQSVKALNKMLPHDEAGWLTYLRFYCFLLEAMDHNLGRVLEALEHSGQRDRTVIVFSSDHGEMGSSHGLAHKSLTMYEENIRVPLVLSDPRTMTGTQSSDALASHLDWVPTLCDLAGLAWPEPAAGLNLLDLAAGRVTRDYQFAESSPRPSLVWRGLRSREWKYFRYLDGPELLYRLADDPDEKTNLAADPGRRDALEHHRALLRQWAAETRDPLYRE